MKKYPAPVKNGPAQKVKKVVNSGASRFIFLFEVLYMLMEVYFS